MLERLVLSALLSFSLAAPGVAQAKPYDDSPPGAPLEFSVGEPKCDGCPEGDEAALNPAVFSDRASLGRSHDAVKAGAKAVDAPTRLEFDANGIIVDEG